MQPVSAKKKQRRRPSARTYTVEFCSFDGDKKAVVQLPFAPFPGLWLQAPWARGDYKQIDGVYWDATENRFEAYATEES